MSQASASDTMVLKYSFFDKIKKDLLGKLIAVGENDGKIQAFLYFFHFYLTLMNTLKIAH